MLIKSNTDSVKQLKSNRKPRKCISLENLSGARTSHYGYVKVENSKREER